VIQRPPVPARTGVRAERDTKTLPITATPSANENCWSMVTTPDAEPASCGGTSARMKFTRRRLQAALSESIESESGRIYATPEVSKRCAVDDDDQSHESDDHEAGAELQDLPPEARRESRPMPATLRGSRSANGRKRRPGGARTQVEPTLEILGQEYEERREHRKEAEADRQSTTNERVRNSDSQTRGEPSRFVFRRSYRTNSTSSTAAAATTPMSQAGQPAAAPRISGRGAGRGPLTLKARPPTGSSLRPVAHAIPAPATMRAPWRRSEWEVDEKHRPPSSPNTLALTSRAAEQLPRDHAGIRWSCRTSRRHDSARER